MSVQVTDDGFLLMKSLPKSSIKRVIDWKALDITPEYVKEQSRLKLTLVGVDFVDQRPFPPFDNEKEMDRYFVADMCLPYNPLPDDRDLFVYYNNIAALSGTAGYMRIRDGYVYGQKVVWCS